METVRCLPYNWKQIDDGDLIKTVEYTPVEPMRHAGCRGEVRLVVDRVSRHCFAREPPQSDDDDHLFNPLPPIASSPSTLMPASSWRKNREKEIAPFDDYASVLCNYIYKCCGYKRKLKNVLCSS